MVENLDSRPQILDHPPKFSWGLVRKCGIGRFQYITYQKDFRLWLRMYPYTVGEYGSLVENVRSRIRILDRRFSTPAPPPLLIRRLLLASPSPPPLDGRLDGCLDGCLAETGRLTAWLAGSLRQTACQTQQDFSLTRCGLAISSLLD